MINFAKYAVILVVFLFCLYSSIRTTSADLSKPDAFTVYNIYVEYDNNNGEIKYKSKHEGYRLQYYSDNIRFINPITNKGYMLYRCNNVFVEETDKKRAI